MKVVAKFCAILFIFSLASLAPLAETKPLPQVKILATTYFAHLWSDYGAYRRVSINGRRMGNYVAINFLPAGSIVMIPELFKTTKLEVADTLAGRGVGVYKGKKYWKVDILCNKHEWIDDFDYPLDLIVVKINQNGRMRDRTVRRNYQLFQSQINLNNLKH